MNNIDWTIHAVVDAYDNNPLLKGMMNLHTHGLNEHGLTELSCVLPEGYDPKEATKMINEIGSMMVAGEGFEIDPKLIHCIDNPDGTVAYRFKLIPVRCYGENSFRIILPDLTGRFFNGKANLKPAQCTLLHTTVFEIEEEKQHLN